LRNIKVGFEREEALNMVSELEGVL